MIDFQKNFLEFYICFLCNTKFPFSSWRKKEHVNASNPLYSVFSNKSLFLLVSDICTNGSLTYDPTLHLELIRGGGASWARAHWHISLIFTCCIMMCTHTQSLRVSWKIRFQGSKNINKKKIVLAYCCYHAM